VQHGSAPLTRLRAVALPLLLGLLAFAVLVSLGTWQVRRLAWKEALIARVEERINAAPLDLRGKPLPSADAAAAFLAENEYRPLRLAGRYLAGNEVRVFTALSDPKGPAAGPGYWAFTPLALPFGEILYVNRGFVPDAAKAAYAPPPAGEVEVVGPLRAPERPNFATPAPDLPARLWFVRDPQAIAAADGLSPVLPYFIDLAASAAPPGGFPQAGETRTRFSNNHLQYAVTWYGLAAALVLVLAAFLRDRLRRAEG